MGARWGHVTAEEITRAVQGECIAGSLQTQFAGLSTDSRDISKNCLFWALKGETFDGHDFASRAVAGGAVGLVVQHGRGQGPYQGREPVVPVVIGVPDTLKALGDLAAWWRRQYPVKVVAITGSAGKTTTKEMAAEILARGCPTLKNQGNFNNLVGLPLTLFSLEEAHRRVVVEMGMNRPGEIGRLTEIADPDVGLITNIGMAHIEGVGDIRGVARAKLELLEKASHQSLILLNGDDGLLMETARGLRKGVITYGLGGKNDIRAENLQPRGPEGFTFDLRHNGGAIPIRLRVPGLQNVFNALAASSIALCLNETEANIVRALDGFQGVKGRFTVWTLPGGTTLVDDTYNANPASLKVALESLADIRSEGGRIIVGLGEMLELGEETFAAHREAGEMVAALGVSHFFAMGEHAPEMIEGALEKGLPKERAIQVHTHRDMVRGIAALMKGRDLVFLKGSRRVGLDKVADALKAGPGEEG